MGFPLVFDSLLIGTGLAMDAFSVSLANGLNEPCMRRRKIFAVAGIFALFQALMPLIGWVCVHTVATYFEAFESAIPWIALALLGFIGGKMLFEGINENRCKEVDGVLVCECKSIGLWALLVQGVATSIDALSVGFTISDYELSEALICALLIALVTFVICYAGVLLGKRFGTALAGKSEILGGAILIFIGVEIFVTSLF
ncbi:MAG: manganese efflux pump [Clostridia bacterium]|nr:manganese efflux pump [Clostridia bacterium]